MICHGEILSAGKSQIEQSGSSQTAQNDLRNTINVNQLTLALRLHNRSGTIMAGDLLRNLRGAASELVAQVLPRSYPHRISRC